MERMLQVIVVCLLAVMPALAEDTRPSPPGDLTVNKIAISDTIPEELRVADLQGQYQYLANQILMIHQDAEFGVDEEAGVLLVRVPEVAAPLTLEHRADCSINSGFNVITTQLAAVDSDMYNPSAFTKRYRSVLVAWTKSRHGVPDVPIRYVFTAQNGDISLNQDALRAYRLSMTNAPVQYVARN